METTKTTVTTKKQAPKKNKVSKKKTKVSKKTHAPKLIISQCAEDYAKALCEPFRFNVQPCIPDLLSIPSTRTTRWSRGTFSTTANDGVANGQGFIAFAPWIISAFAQNCFALNLTDGLFNNTGGISTPTNLPTTGSIYRDLVGLIPSGPTGPGNYSFRVVAAGLRIRCTTPTLFEGGTIVMARADGSESLSRDYNAIIARPTSVLLTPKNHGWKQVVYRPSITQHYEYNRDAPGNIEPFFYTLAFYVQAPRSTPGSTFGLTFDYECKAYYELVGPATSMMGVTPSHSDVVGMSAVRSVVDDASHVSPEGGAPKGMTWSYEEMKTSIESAGKYMSYIKPLGEAAYNYYTELR